MRVYGNNVSNLVMLAPNHWCIVWYSKRLMPKYVFMLRLSGFLCFDFHQEGVEPYISELKTNVSDLPLGFSRFFLNMFKFHNSGWTNTYPQAYEFHCLTNALISRWFELIAPPAADFVASS